MKVLFISDNDLISKRFNGYDYHDILLNYNVESSMIVNNKMSKVDYVHYINPLLVNNFTLSIFKNKHFIEADIVHLQLIQGSLFDINYLPLITRLKPTVITLHDPFFLGGHCVHHFDCEKWKTHCEDCKYLNIKYSIEYDDTALQFAIKKLTINNSYISVIFASEWMNNLVKQSPIWKGKNSFIIPFGINQNIFKPCNTLDAKEKFGIDKNSIVIMFRCQNDPFKGMDIIKYALKNIYSDVKITLIAVGKKGLLNKFKKKYIIKEFEWITDDAFLSGLYQASDIFLMPSSQEAFGLMAIEAMSCGKMVLSTLNTALEYTINHPDCGIAVDHEPEIYKNELQRLLDNFIEIKLRGEKCFEFAKNNYNYDKYFTNLINVYNNVIQQYNNRVSENNIEDVVLITQQLKKYNVDYNNNIKKKQKNIKYIIKLILIKIYNKIFRVI